MKYIFKKLLTLLIGLMWFVGSCGICFAACDELTPSNVSVSGYYRSDGTYVRPYNRRPPGGAQQDKPYEMLELVSFLSIFGSAVFLVRTANNLRKEWRYELEYEKRKKSRRELLPALTQYSSTDKSFAFRPKAPDRKKITDPQPSKLVGPISRTIAHGKRIRFNYKNRSGNESIRTIKPISLRKIGNDFYVYGFCYRRKSERTFALKRISKLRRLT